MIKLPSISPAGRAGLIIGGLFFAFLGISTFWVAREASRVSRQKRLNASVSNATTGEMIWVPPGRFTMGGIGDNVPPDELPLHDVRLDGFWMDKTEVTNEQFDRFISATGYQTVAERPLTPQSMPGIQPEFVGKTVSLCFIPPRDEKSPVNAYQWWTPVIGANWRHPEGPGSSIAGREKHPVVHVCYEDATAYARWAGKRLPTEAEWEYAARGGLVSKPFVWGSDKNPNGQWLMNIWQGEFPRERRVEDGFETTAPVASFPPNGYGLHDMAGNVWEITEDWYRPDTYFLRARQPDRSARQNPQGPADSFDPDEPGARKKVTRGGSFMCSDNYCRGYRPSARMKTAPDTGLQNTGFRCVRSATK